MDGDAIRGQLRQRNLDAFRIVFETCSITRAAERLDLSQPAVSQLIGRIEQAFGFVLFVRGMGRRLQPTKAATAIYPDVCRALDAMTGIEEAASRLADGGTGPVAAREPSDACRRWSAPRGEEELSV
ncbi:MAG: LysR family transcriptional regulator [Alphaproteobacteria bacterium]